MGSCFSKKTNVYAPNNLDKNTSPLVKGVTFVRKDSFTEKDVKNDESQKENDEKRKSETPVIIVTSVSTGALEDLVTVEERQQLAQTHNKDDSDSNSSDEEQDFHAVPEPCNLVETSTHENKHESEKNAKSYDSSSSDDEDTHHLAEMGAPKINGDAVTEQDSEPHQSEEDLNELVASEEKNAESSSSSDEEEDYKQDEPERHLVHTFELFPDSPKITLDVIQEATSSEHETEQILPNEEAETNHSIDDDETQSDAESNKEGIAEPSSIIHIDTDVIINTHIVKDESDSSESSDEDEIDSKSHDSDREIIPKSVHFDSNLEKHIPDENESAVHIEEVQDTEVQDDVVVTEEKHTPLGLSLSMEYLSKMDINGAEAIPISDIDALPMPEINSVPTSDDDSDSSSSSDDDTIHHIQESDMKLKSVNDTEADGIIAHEVIKTETEKGNDDDVIHEGRFRIESLSEPKH